MFETDLPTSQDFPHFGLITMLASCSLSVARHWYNCLRWNSELSVMNLINSNRCKWPNKNWGLVNSYVVSRLISRPSQMLKLQQRTGLQQHNFRHPMLTVLTLVWYSQGFMNFPSASYSPDAPRAVFNVSPRRGITLLPPPPPPASPTISLCLGYNNSPI